MFTYYGYLRKGGEKDVDGQTVDSFTKALEDQAGWIAVSGLHSKRIHSGLVRAGTELPSEQERSVGDGTINQRVV